MKRRRLLPFLASLAVMSAIMFSAPTSLYPQGAAQAATGGLNPSPASGAPSASVYVYISTNPCTGGAYHTSCYYDMRWDDPISGQTLCTVMLQNPQSGPAGCTLTVPSDDIGPHTLYMVDSGCNASCASYATGTFTISECNANDVLHTLDADTYSIEPYAGFNPITATDSELTCYNLTPRPVSSDYATQADYQAALNQWTADMQGMTYDVPTGADAAGAIGSVGTGSVAAPPPDGVEIATTTVTPLFFPFWSGYADRRAQTQKFYTGVRARWTVPASELPAIATLPWVGIGSGFDADPGCDANAVDPAFVNQNRG